MVSLPSARKQDARTSRPNIIAMVWAPEENRTATYARFLNAPLFNIHYLLYKRPFVAPLKYIAQALKTWWVLARHRPRFVYITNPPAFAPLCVYLYCKFTRTRYIMDTHSPALFSRRWGWTLPLQRFLAKRATMNIVDQQRFEALFESWGAPAMVLEKPPTNLANRHLQHIGDSTVFEITVINTFAVDEPVDIILEAARRLPEARFYVLGDTRHANPEDLRNTPSNVVFTDYLLGDDYWNRLYSSRAVMALTTYPFSLLAGAQDGGAVGRPLILSRQPALTEYFPRGAVFIDNTVDGIVAGVREMMAHEDTLTAEIHEMVEVQKHAWEQQFRTLNDLIALGSG
ncbi:MAG: hypothetical protein IPK19_05625 [Chloroflexi bacterium]|nr:hypothetical protein [Chloroflexota bacterium]